MTANHDNFVKIDYNGHFNSGRKHKDAGTQLEENIKTLSNIKGLGLIK